MAKGSVIEYRGKRGKVFRIKFTDASGKQVMETLGREDAGWTRARAEGELGDRLSDVRRKGYRRPQPTTFLEAANRWRDETKLRKGWRDSTEAQYRSILKRLIAHFGPMPVGAVRPSDVSAYVRDELERVVDATGKTRAPASVTMDLTILYGIFQWAVVNELRESNPAQGIGRPHVRQRKGHDLSPAQVQALLRSFDDEQARAAFLTMVLTGIRRSELQAMRWRDLDLIENRLKIPDSKSDTGVRVVAIAPPLAEELWQHRRRSNFQGDDERVFCNPELGSEYHIGTKYRPALERAFERAGLPWPEGLRPCHDLRVTAITTDARNGTDPIAIMTNAGHASYSTTKRYVKLAGVIFPDTAAARAQRLLSTEPSTDLSTPESIEADLGTPSGAESSAADAA